MTVSNKLTQMKAKNLGAGKHFDGQGLMLVKKRKDVGKWILRLVVNGRRREMGLGRWPDVSIGEARDSAAEARKTLRSGADPVKARQDAKRRFDRLTVSDAIDQCFEARQAELKGDGKAGRWMSPLSVHVIPKIGRSAIEDVDQHVLKRIFDPIWHEKPDAARKAMNRMNLTLKHAAALGVDVDLQAVMKAQALLGRRRHSVKHIPSLPFQEVPSFYRSLCKKETMAALALRFLILTVARTSEVRFGTRDEIEGNLWVIPAERTKTGREHRIPLVQEALRIVKRARVGDGQKLLFPAKGDNPMSDAAMSALMKRERMDARPHGFRSSFRSWAEECTDAQFEVKEAALGQQVGSSTVRAYQRSSLIQARRQLNFQWEMFVTGGEPNNSV